MPTRLYNKDAAARAYAQRAAAPRVQWDDACLVETHHAASSSIPRQLHGPEAEFVETALSRLPSYTKGETRTAFAQQAVSHYRALINTSEQLYPSTRSNYHDWRIVFIKRSTFLMDQLVSANMLVITLKQGAVPSLTDMFAITEKSLTLVTDKGKRPLKGQPFLLLHNQSFKVYASRSSSTHARARIQFMETSLEQIKQAALQRIQDYIASHAQCSSKKILRIIADTMHKQLAHHVKTIPELQPCEAKVVVKEPKKTVEKLPPLHRPKTSRGHLKVQGHQVRMQAKPASPPQVKLPPIDRSMPTH